MRLLGIDYGRKKIGVALGSEILAEPYAVIRFSNEKEAMEKITRIAKKEDVDRIVVGVSERAMGEESKRFGKELSEETVLPVDFFDETLTTQEAQKKALEAGIRRSKRKAMEDAYAASLMLQLYIETNV